MSSYFVLTAVGPDRPGLVDEISAFLAERRINIEDTRMAVLGGEFAVILLASGDAPTVEGIAPELSRIGKDIGLSIQIRPTIDPVMRKAKPAIPYRVTATSMDHPGIVHEITRVLAGHSVNIESMDTHVAHAPVSGAPIFTMRCTVGIPVEEKLSVIKRELETLGDRLNIDIDFESIESFLK